MFQDVAKSFETEIVSCMILAMILLGQHSMQHHHDRLELAEQLRY